MRFFSMSPEKDEDMTYEANHLIEINISPKTTIQADENKHLKIPAFDKSWINYKRSTEALAIKCHSEKLMSKGARRLYNENNVILITTEGAAHISTDGNLFNFNNELEPKHFRGSLPFQTKFAELYQA